MKYKISYAKLCFKKGNTCNLLGRQASHTQGNGVTSSLELLTFLQWYADMVVRTALSISEID